MLSESKDWVNNLQMQKHPEGGFYKEIYRSTNQFTPKEIGDCRNYATSILFLLNKGDVSHFHQIKSDEIWYYHTGASCLIHVINVNGELITYKLGLDFQNGEVLQLVVPAGCIFASESSGDYSLVGCMVSPGFDFSDFKLFTTKELVNLYVHHEKIIKKFTKEKYD